MKKLLSLLCVLMLLAASLALTGCTPTEEEITLNVYNWGEYISDGSEGSLHTNEEFEKYYYETYGVKVRVNYTTYASNEDMYNKIRSGATTYDVVIPSDYMIQRMISEDLLRPLNFDNIPNIQYISEDFRNLFYDPDNLYSVPYTYGVVGLIYNTTMVEEAPTDWDCMWDERYAGQILQFNNPRDAFGTAMYSLGIDVNTTDKSKWVRAKDRLSLQKPLIQSYVMDEIFNKMKNGSAAIAPYYAGDFLSMYEDNSDLAFVYPESGTNIFVDAMCIPYNSRHADIAEAYINFMLSEEVAIANAEYIYYASPNKLVYENEDYIADMKEVHEDVMDILYPENIGELGTFYQNLSPEMLEYQNRLWESLKIESTVESWIYVVSGAIVAALLALLIYRFALQRYREKHYYSVVSQYYTKK
ncbi:MAG: spermidine/putrescine ABC transporter substrate-binding protein [Clostridia bacterium]|nr:spermidine/putrescine ABC transporter substrate-binding protein [Clostridia bacterium]